MKIPHRPRLHDKKSVEKMLERRRILHRAQFAVGSLDEFIKAHGRHRSTLWRWKQKWTTKGSLLDERHTKAGPSADIDDDAIAYALCYRSVYPKAKLTMVASEVRKVCEIKGWEVPSYQKLRRAFLALPADLVCMLKEGFHETFYTLSATVMRIQAAPRQVCQMDTTELDLWVLDLATGDVCKLWMTTIIDCYSRCIMGLMLYRNSPTERDVLRLLKQTILPKNREDWPFYGKMTEITCDNAACFKGSDVKEAMLRLGIVYEDGPPYCANANGKQERFFLTFKEQLLANLMGYTAQLAGLAKAQRAAIPWPLVEGIVLRFLSHYHTHLHRGIGCTPWERYMEAPGAIDGLVFDVQEIIDALKVRRFATVRRFGVEIEKRRYSSPALVGLVSRTIEVRIDTGNPNETVEAYLDGEFLCDLRPWDQDAKLPKDVAKARADRLAVLKQMRKDLRKFVKTAPPITSEATRVVPPRKSESRGADAGLADGHRQKKQTSGEIPDLPTED